MSDNADLLDELQTLKAQRHAVILAHNYQLPEVQDAADFVGDSLGLSRQAAATDAEVIVFCGVHFMAETAKLLSPDKLVLIPEPRAGCPMADMITAEQLRDFKAQHPGAPVVAYVNTSAAVKAESEVCCTSANAPAVVRSLPERRILFIPDQCLGAWVARQVPDKEIISYPGFCPTHWRIRPESILQLKTEHPQAVVMAHPECPEDILALADAVLSTSGMLRWAGETEATEIIVVTEVGLLHQLRRRYPEKTFHPLGEAVCPNMKMTTLPKLVASLRDLTTEITIPEEIAVRARQSVQRMIELG
ncbi:MAG TPA: quinolinate synthase NadA [Armatimonadota bacterium]|jgi:quinolinate synthase